MKNDNILNIGLHYWCVYYITRNGAGDPENGLFARITDEIGGEAETIDFFDKIFYTKVLHHHNPEQIINTIYELLLGGSIDYYERGDEIDKQDKMYAIEKVIFDLYYIYKEWEPSLFLRAKEAYMKWYPQYLKDIQGCSPNLMHRLLEWGKRERIKII